MLSLLFNKTGHRSEHKPVKLKETYLEEFDIKRADPVGVPGHDGPNNMILSENLRLCIDTKKSHRNLSTILYGHNASNAFFMPNIMQADMSYIVQDVSGELYHSCGNYLKGKGYDVKCVEPSELSTISEDEIASYGFSKKALFIKQPMDDANDTEISGFLSKAIRAITFHAGENKIIANHTVHTAVMIPDFEILPDIEVLSNSRCTDVLGVMRLYNVSLNIGVQHRSVFMKQYADTYSIIEGNCDTLIYLGDIGCATWNKKQSPDILSKAVFLDNECIVAERGTEPYIDSQYRVVAN